MLVLGEAGVGKTRLLDELVRAASDEALVLRGRCLSYGEGITFWPIVEALRLGAGVDRRRRRRERSREAPRVRRPHRTWVSSTASRR